MGCRHEWSTTSEHVMLIHVEAPWTWEELMQDGAILFAEIRAFGKPCATIVDVRQIGGMPKGNPLTYLTEIDRQMPDTVFASAVVGAPYMVNVFMDILTNIRPRAKRIALFAHTMEEAYAKIQARYDAMPRPPSAGAG
ncbi:MAG: hypothetical protein LCI00_28115 [Chloroflexi bacterium]|nr:hypothetical protein [Chloroflexota bacterium]MCC6896817.1 hypothetical protein [Anaerolineae bacterium]